MLDKLESQARVERPVVEMHPWVGRVGLFMAVGVAYFLAAQLGLALLTTAERVAVFWPASGLAVGILIALGPGARWPVAAGVIAATLAANLMGERAVWGALAFGLCNAGEALLAMWLIGRWFGPAFDLDTLRRVVGFFAAAAIATAGAALGAAGAMKLFGPSTAQFLDVWQVWFRSDALGLVTVAPLLVGVAATVRDAPSRRELLEGTLAVVAVAVVNGLALFLPAGPWSLMAPAVFLFPLLLWIGSRCRPAFAAAAAFTVGATIVWTTIYGFGRYGDPSPAIADRVLAAQVTMLGITLAALAVAALFAERRKAELALAEREAQLGLAGKAARVGSFAIDIATGRVHNSAGYAAIHGLPEGTEEFPRERWRARVHPDDLPRLDALRSRAFAERRREHNTEYRLPGADGSVQWIESRGLITYDEDGCPTRLAGVNIDITERKKADEELRKSESETRELLRALAEQNAQFALAEKSALVGSFAYDVGRNTLRISDGYAAIHGFPNETKEVPRSSWLAGVHPEDRARVEELRSRAFSARSPEYSFDFRIVRPGGEVRWIEGRAFVAYRDDGRPQRVAGVNIDVTERKRAEAALEESRARYCALYHDNPAMYFTVDASGTVSSVNEFGARQLGYTPAELVGQPVLGMIHEGDREEARQWLAACVENGGTISRAEMRKVRRDGSILWVRKLARAVEGFGDQTLLIVCEDITERKEAELLLAEREAQLELAGKAARVGSFVIDYATERIHTSPGFAAAHGLAEETEGLTCEEWRAHLLPDDRARFEALRSEVFAEQRRELNMEYRIVGADGEARWIESRGLVSYDGDGRPMRLVGVHIDITERKQAEQALAERNAQLGLAGKFALVGTFTYDVGTEKYEVSPGYAAIHGLPEGTEETTRAEWRTRVHPNDLPTVEAGFERAITERRCEYYCEYRFFRPDGEIRWIDSRNFISYADGSAPRLVGANIDVTQRKVAEATLEEHKASLADALLAGRVVAFEWDAVTHQTRRSDNAASILGHDEGGPTAPLRNDFLRRVHSDDRELFRSKIRGLSPSSPSYVLNFRFFRRDGRQVWLEETGTGTFNGTGRLSRIKGLTRDITEGKETELALAERTVQLALAGKAALVGAYAYDTDTEMMQISEGYVAIHGFPEGTAEIARSACLAGVHPDDVGRVEHSRREAFRACRREYSVEYRIIRPGGEMRWVETRCFITYDSEGSLHRVVGVTIDITERKRVEEQQGKLVAELDHRVKNVLATVQAVAAHTMQTSRSMEDFVAALDGRIRSMGSTHELLSHRRWAGIPLAELVERELAPYTTGSNSEIGGPDVTLSAEAGQTMGMVLHELVTNAAKHGALSVPSGRVSIRWRLPFNGNASDRLVLAWRETGGPVVVPPGKSGYGMDVVRSVIPYELGGTVDHVLAPEGARCRIEIPLALLGGGSMEHKQSASVYAFHASDDFERRQAG